MSAPEKRISYAQMKLRHRNPFFASLALFAGTRISELVDTAATDGRDIYFNPDFLEKLSNEELDGVLLHEVLHAALLHVSRRGGREAMRWNVAADIVVNNMIDEQGLALPPGAIREPKWANRSVEEIYLLLDDSQLQSMTMPDLRPKLGPGNDEARAAELRAHWRMAKQQAQVIARQQGAGSGVGNAGREWEILDTPQIDWRSELWRYLVQTPVDFEGYDRRFVHRGLYIDQMQGESLQLWVAIDTSGSISDDDLNEFMAELLGILRSYPSIRCSLFFADTALHGPYEVNGNSEVPAPVGGGGTSFQPFFEALGECPPSDMPYVCVYLTDGYGDFPPVEPGIPTLWLVTPGGLRDEQFPFGNVVRLIDPPGGESWAA